MLDDSLVSEKSKLALIPRSTFAIVCVFHVRFFFHPKIWRIQKYSYLCSPVCGNGAVAQLNRASDYGSEGCGFESLRRHKVFIVLVFVPV